MNYFPFFLLIATGLLVLPSRILKKRQDKYTEKMKENIWIDNFTEVSKDELKTNMVQADNEVGTTEIRQQTYNYFADQFVESLIENLNNATLSNAQKAEKITQAIDFLEMNFEVKAIQKLETAKDKLQGNVAL